MIDFNYYYDDSIMHRADPLLKFLSLIFFSILICRAKGILLFIISSVLIIISILLSKISLKRLFSPLLRLIPLLAAILIVNTFFYNNGECIYQFHLLCLSKEGFLQGLNIILRTITIIGLSFVFIQTTTSIEIMDAIEHLLLPLRFLKIRTRDISLIMSISIQFIPIIFSDFERIKKAQIIRGADFSDKSIRGTIKTVIPVVIPAFISVFRRADELSMAIEARGYNSEDE